ncbi:mitogen-activated protein kinase kinase kinase STE11 [Sugiyamaella lignohabitans]|uniref:Mitogen-activated protein kinase kinase kinase STE11 n=1 Tax=Sugiyamaella lignohabitans TaxID=796027 RepID=A0A161HEZ9_9ASCO|nr:mitogen-activated protein kinase kinase kinase STE11 [Sugiyamaella lignohabitans]ANB13990.1 mitogen-activated protein kinase kinase kinase STE11 [Sugiyamaella lignohabitans]
MCLSFGNFPEPLLAGYIVQVLNGLRFLHEQGTIHRDIKGANILTDKEGKIKLADFGVATQSVVGTLSRDKSVVGTPYWMAPEVIEVNGATAASDIWSLGCTIVELLTGKPPNYHLDPMSAMYAIVSKEIPLPEGISSELKDFLLECFQKDPNLRVSAKALQKHPWLKKHSPSMASSNTKYEEAIKTVKIHNSPKRATSTTLGDDIFSPVPRAEGGKRQSPVRNSLFNVSPAKRRTSLVQKGDPPLAKNLAKQFSENWHDDDDEFADLEGDLNADRLQAVLSSKFASRQPPKPDFKLESEPMQRQTSQTSQVSLESQLSDISLTDESRVSQSNGKSRSSDIHGYAETNENDYTNDFEDVGTFDTMALSPFIKESPDIRGQSTKESPPSVQEPPPSAAVSMESTTTADTDNPFLKIESEDVVEADPELRMAHTRLEQVISTMENASNSADLKNTTEELLDILRNFPETRTTFFKSSGLSLAYTVLRDSTSKTVVVNIVHLLLVIAKDEANANALDDFWLLGGMQVVIRLLSRRKIFQVRSGAATLIEQCCNDSLLSLQSFMACGGLKYLYELLEEDCQKERVLVRVALTMLKEILQTITSSVLRKSIYKNLCEDGVMNSLVSIPGPNNASKDLVDLTLNLLLSMSQDSIVRANIGLNYGRKLLSKYDKVQEQKDKLSILKFVKNISQEQSHLEPNQEVSIISLLVTILQQATDKASTAIKKDVLNQAVPALFNICRLNGSRQEKAAEFGLVPILTNILQDTSIQSRDNVRQLALQMLCDMTHAGKLSREELNRNNCLELLLTYVPDPYWQRDIYDALGAWLRGDINIQHKLATPPAVDTLLDGLKTNINGISYGDLMNSFGSMIRLSPLLCKSMPLSKFYSIIRGGLLSTDPLVIVNVLRVLNIVVETTGATVLDAKLRDQLKKHAKTNNSKLARQLASDLLGPGV